MHAALVDIRGITRTYGRLAALHDVSFTIRAGEVLGLVGPNGAGKTTLLECIAGTLPADRGLVLRDGRAIPVTERSRHLFYLPDAVAPWPSQTASWVLDYIVALFGGGAVSRDDVEHELRLAPLLDTRIGALSKGQRKRVALGAALLTPQPLLIADEPFEGLDLRQSRDVAGVLRRQAAAGRTLLLSIHQIADAARVCDRLVLLSAGAVRGEGTVDELTRIAEARTGTDAPDLEEVVLALT